MEDSIRKARTDAGLTQKQVANLIGVPTRTVERWESGERKCAEYQERLITEKIRREYFVPLDAGETDHPEPKERFRDTGGEFIPAFKVVELFLMKEADAKEYLSCRISQNLIDRGCELAKKAYADDAGVFGISSLRNPYMRSMEMIFGRDISRAILALFQSQTMLWVLDYRTNKAAYYCPCLDYNFIYVLRNPGEKVDTAIRVDIEKMKVKPMGISNIPKEIALAAKEYLNMQENT